MLHITALQPPSTWTGCLLGEEYGLDDLQTENKRHQVAVNNFPAAVNTNCVKFKMV